MTVVDLDTEEQYQLEEPQVLFHEARQRRRKRWLISGIVLILVGAAIGTIISTTGSSARSTRRSSPVTQSRGLRYDTGY